MERIIAVPSTSPPQHDDLPTCRACCSTKLLTDYAQGDIVCTDCGVVQSSHIIDDRPEWRDHNQDEEVFSHKARSGLVPVDETKYIGGLQPTRLSKTVFGGGDSAIRKKLSATNRKCDRLMEKKFKQSLQKAEITIKTRKRKLEADTNTEATDIECEPDPYEGFPLEEDVSLQADFEGKLQKDKLYLLKQKSALFAEKWSLERARNISDFDDDSTEKELLEASKELCSAHDLLLEGGNNLELPPSIVNEAGHKLAQYATKLDGIKVQGIASAAGYGVKRKSQQHAALCAALLFWTARNQYQPRTLQAVCQSFSSIKVQKSHCSQAMKELRRVFPEWSRSSGSRAHVEMSNISTSNRKSPSTSQATKSTTTFNFVAHFLRNLNLPPVAKAAISFLVELFHAQNEIKTTSLPTVCASTAMFLCITGRIMQKLSKQAHQTKALAAHGVADLSSFSSDKKKKTKITQKLLSGAPKTLNLSAEHAAYEMGRVWGVWGEQLEWDRTMSQIEQATKVSETLISDFYRLHCFPRRSELFQKLKFESRVFGSSQLKDDNILRQTPLADMLLSHLYIAIPLMPVDPKN